MDGSLRRLLLRPRVEDDLLLVEERLLRERLLRDFRLLCEAFLCVGERRRLLRPPFLERELDSMAYQWRIGEICLNNIG